jgi:hypothetical protein
MKEISETIPEKPIIPPAHSYRWILDLLGSGGYPIQSEIDSDENAIM